MDSFNSYTAGLLDGEGCFYIYKRKKGTLYGGMEIAITYYPILDTIYQEYGGILYKTKAGVNKPIWKWKIYGDAAIDMIDRIGHHLHEKQSQAYLLKDFLCWRSEQPRWDHYNNILTDWESVYWMVDRMKRLKK